MDVILLSAVIWNMHGDNGDVEGFLHVVRVADDCLAPWVAVPGIFMDFESTLGSNQADKPWHFATTGEGQGEGEGEGEGVGKERERGLGGRGKVRREREREEKNKGEGEGERQIGGDTIS